MVTTPWDRPSSVSRDIYQLKSLEDFTTTSREPIHLRYKDTVGMYYVPRRENPVVSNITKGQLPLSNEVQSKHRIFLKRGEKQTYLKCGSCFTTFCGNFR